MKRRNIVIAAVVVVMVVALFGGFAAYQFLWNTSNEQDEQNVGDELNTDDTMSGQAETSNSASDDVTSGNTSTTVSDMSAEIKTMITEDLSDMLAGGDTLDENIADLEDIDEEYLDDASNLAYRYAVGGYDTMLEGTERINVVVNSVNAVTVTDTTKIFTVEYTGTVHDEVIRDESNTTIPDMNISIIATLVLNSDNKIVSWTEEVVERSYVE